MQALCYSYILWKLCPGPPICGPEQGKKLLGSWPQQDSTEIGATKYLVYLAPPSGLMQNLSTFDLLCWIPFCFLWKNYINVDVNIDRAYALRSNVNDTHVGDGNFRPPFITRMPSCRWQARATRKHAKNCSSFPVKTSWRQVNNLFEVMEIWCLVIKFFIQITSTYIS